jgi:protein-tyrosine kinase
MSRFGRAMEKAEREGLLTWTRGGGPAEDQTLPVDPPALATAPWARPHGPVPVPAEDLWGDAPAIEAALDPVLVVSTDPRSPAAEQYRLLRTRLERLDQTSRSQLLIVSSPGIGEGKTTTSTNLALSMAEEPSRRVVLVDADLRRPGLAALLGVRAEPGLLDVLVGAATLDDALVPVPGTSLILLPAGLPDSHAAGLLGSPLMQRCLDTLRGRFDRIVVDTAPLAVADTHVLTRAADGILVVVRSGVTARPALERALAGLDRAKVAGIVLNGTDAESPSYAEAVPSRGTGV